MTRRCLPLVSLPNDTVPVDFGEQAGILRRARLEELGHPRKTAGDVARLRRFLRDARQHFADAHLLAVLDGDDRAELERDVDRQFGARELDLLALFVQRASPAAARPWPPRRRGASGR